MSAVNLDLFTRPKPSDPDSKWARWIAKPESRAVLEEIERRALAAWHNGDQRVEVNGIVADVRRDLKVSVDNSLRSILARRLVERYPVLEPLIELRARKAAP